MLFELEHDIFDKKEVFGVDNAPNWLRYGGREGSTMCNRWFWNNHIVTLQVGESFKTDFNTITRIE